MESLVNIVVCAKYSLDVAELKVDSSTRKPVTVGVPRKISDIDRNAVEEAIKLKEKHGGKITAVTLGPPEAKAGLKEALAMGVDEAHLVAEASYEKLDTLTTADILAAVIKKLEGFDLILCGEMTIDGFSSQVGPRLAERLNIPQITYARKVTVEDGNVVAERDLEESYEVVKAKMPALLSVTREINTPRLPSLMAILKASKKELKTMTIGDLGFNLDDLQQKTPLNLIHIEAPDMKRKGVIISEKPAKEAAEELVSILMKERVVGA